MAKFCPRCGAQDADFYKGFCIKCYKEMHTFVKFPEKIEIVRCKRCGLWFVKGKWVTPSSEILDKLVSVKVKTKLNNPAFSAELKEDTVEVKVRGHADAHNQLLIEEEKEIPLGYKERICDVCNKFSGSYYEIKIQLRSGRRLLDPIRFKKVASFIKSETRHIGTRDERATAFWVEEVREGIDFFFAFKVIGDEVLKRVLGKFKLEHERSSQFVGMTKDGKKKVRFTYCIRV